MKSFQLLPKFKRTTHTNQLIAEGSCDILYRISERSVVPTDTQGSRFSRNRSKIGGLLTVLQLKQEQESWMDSPPAPPPLLPKCLLFK